MRSKSLNTMMALSLAWSLVGLTNGCAGKKDDDKSSAVKTPVSIVLGGLKLSQPNSDQPMSYAEAAKNPIVVTATLSMELPVDDQAIAESLGQIIELYQLDSDGEFQSVSGAKVKLELGGSELKATVARQTLPWDGGDFRLQFVAADLGDSYRYVGEASQDFSVARVYRDMITYDGNDQQAQLHESEISLSAAEVSRVEASESLLAEVYAQDFAITESVDHLVSQLVNEMPLDEQAAKLANTLGSVVGFLACYHSQATDCDPKEHVTTPAADLDSLFKVYSEVTQDLATVAATLQKEVFFTFSFHLHGLTVHPGKSFTEPTSYSITSDREGERHESKLPSSAFGALVGGISLDYLFNMKSGLVPTPVPEELNIALPIKMSTIDFATGEFSLHVNRVWLNKVFGQDTSKVELLQLNLPATEDRVYDLVGGFSTAKGLEMTIKVIP